MITLYKVQTFFKILLWQKGKTKKMSDWRCIMKAVTLGFLSLAVLKLTGCGDTGLTRNNAAKLIIKHLHLPRPIYGRIILIEKAVKVGELQKIWPEEWDKIYVPLSKMGLLNLTQIERRDIGQIGAFDIELTKKGKELFGEPHHEWLKWIGGMESVMGVRLKLCGQDLKEITGIKFHRPQAIATIEFVLVYNNFTELPKDLAPILGNRAYRQQLRGHSYVECSDHLFPNAVQSEIAIAERYDDGWRLRETKE